MNYNMLKKVSNRKVKFLHYIIFDAVINLNEFLYKRYIIALMQLNKKI
jgi:hypothetical protein